MKPETKQQLRTAREILERLEEVLAKEFSEETTMEETTMVAARGNPAEMGAHLVKNSLQGAYELSQDIMALSLAMVRLSMLHNNDDLALEIAEKLMEVQRQCSHLLKRVKEAMEE